MKLRFTSEALNDLIEVGHWAGQDYPDRDEVFLKSLVQRCQSLTTFPSRHPVIEGNTFGEIRKLVVGSHLVFYSIVRNDILVLRVVHGARNWEQLFTKGTARQRLGEEG